MINDRDGQAAYWLPALTINYSPSAPVIISFDQSNVFLYMKCISHSL